MPSGLVPTISCVAPGGSGWSFGTASPRAMIPRSNFCLAALTFSGVTGGSPDATEAAAFFFAFAGARAGAFREDLAVVVFVVLLVTVLSLTPTLSPKGRGVNSSL